MSAQNLELALKIAAQTSGKEQIKQLVNELDNIATTSKGADNEAAKLAKELDALSEQQALINNFQQSSLALEKQELATVAAAQALEKLQKEAKDTNKPFVSLAKSITAAEKDLSEMRGELSKQTAKHKALQNQLTKTGVNTKNLSAKKRELAAAFTQTGKKIDSYQTKLKQGNAAEKAHAGNLGNITNKIIALTAAYVGLNQVGAAIKNIFTTGDKFERLGVQMNALMGSIKSGEQATAWVKDFAAKTPLQLADVSKAFVKLKAFGLDPMDGTMQAITDQAFKLGGGFQEVEGISLALGQAWAKQKLQGEEILQLVERGIPVWDLLEKATGKNTAELQKLSSAGKLGRDVIKKLIDEMGKGAAGAAADNMKLLSGLMSNAKDNLDQFYDLISKSGAMDYLKAQFTALNEKFSEMKNDGSLKEWAQAISDTIVATSEAIKQTFTTLYEYKDEIASIAKVWLALKVGNYFSNVVAGARTAIASLATYRGAIIATETATKSATMAAGKWKKAIAFMGKATLYTALINELIQVGFLYKDLVVAENKVAQSKRLSTELAEKLAFKYKQLSKETGVNITNTAQFNQALEKGTIVWDESLKRYQSAAQIQQKLAKQTKLATQEEKEHQETMVLSTEQALKATNQLAKQAQNLNGVRAGTQGFINVIESSIVALKKAGDQYNNQISLLKRLKEKYIAHNESLKRQKYLADNVAKAYEQLGIKSGKALDELARKQRGAFELIQQTNQPLVAQKQAFLVWAEAALNAAQATNTLPPAILSTTAASLGLSEEFNKLSNRTRNLKNDTDDLTDANERFKRSLIDNKNLTEEQRQKQEELNEANEAAAAKAGANVAFQKLWNEALERSKQVYDYASESAENLTKRTEELRESLAQSFRTQSWSDIMAPINALNNLAKQNELQAIAQARAYQELTQNLQNNALSVDSLNYYSREANTLFDKLSEADLSALQQQIDNAKAATQGLKNELVDTLKNLKNELDDLEGNKQAILARNYEADKLILQQKLKAAQKAGDKQALADAEEALRIQRKIYEIKSKSIKTEQTQQAIETVENSKIKEEIKKPATVITKNSIQQSTIAPANPARTVRTVRLELIIAGETFKADLLSEFEERFIATLEQTQGVIGSYT